MNTKVLIRDGGLPFPIVVYFVQRPYPGSGLREPVTGRVGQCMDESEIGGLVAKDKEGMGNTYGGLFEPFRGQNHRTYHAFKAEWVKLEI